MHYNQSCGRRRNEAMAPEAAKGYRSARGQNPFYLRSQQRAVVNIYKTDSSYEMLVFAPGRIKEHFAVDVNGQELRVSYTPPEGFPRPEWVLREYSRGGFERSFQLDNTVDTTAITARYEDGVLHVSLPLIAGKEVTRKEVAIS